MWPWKTARRYPEYKYASENSKIHPPPNHGITLGSQPHFMYLMVGCLCFGILLMLLNVYQLSSMNAGLAVGDPEFGTSRRPIVWMNAKNLRSGYLKHVIAVFSRVGFTRTETESRFFDVMWAHDYPFVGKHNDLLLTLEPHQKINHFPGSGFITNKVSLATNHFPFIPPAFVIPKDKNTFLKEIAKYPEKFWVEKSNSHRGIHIKSPGEIDLTKGSDENFVQEYIANPLLIDGRKFDVGIYTVLTSIDPLRVYVFDPEVLIRIQGEDPIERKEIEYFINVCIEDYILFEFCEKDYLPFDPNDEEKYVVGDAYTQPWELPSLKSIWTKGKYTRKMLLNVYLRQQGKDDAKIWRDMYNAIAEVYLKKEPDLISSASQYKSSRNFFELVRFDFILDADMKVWLMEVNMSPNLSSASHRHNKLMYEQVIFNLLGLVGVATKLDHSLKYSSPSEKEMLVSDEQTEAQEEKCASKECTQSCHHEMCQLCYSCLKEDQREFIKAAFLEHSRRGAYRRVYPPPMNPSGQLKQNSVAVSLSATNQLMFHWFKAMCLRDLSWCT